MNKPNRVLANQHHRLQRPGRTLLLSMALLLGIGSIALAGITPDVASTRHNLSASNASRAATGSSFGATVKATSETQICVFCHTPHSAKSGSSTFVAPLWNRNLSPDATYTQFYDSTSLDASPKPGSAGVGTGSKLCLSCHDGTLAIGTVGVLNNASGNIAMKGTRDALIDGTGGKMPDGTKGANTGFTRRIGVDLSNDHPISFTYNSTLANDDGELYKPGISLDINGKVAVAGRVVGQPKPQFPLIVPVGSTDKTSGQMECITCHDPHLKSDALDPVTFAPINNKFLRGNRFQLVSPTPTSLATGAITNSYDPSKDIICLACHNKPTWATSTHANVQATSERYKSSASDLRDFPRNISTWQAACANCHDMHTVPGARRLLREATDSTASPKIGGGTPAVEQVCFQCHSPSGDRILVAESPDQVPDIKTAFSYKVHMPIVTAEQGEVPIGGGPTGNTDEIHKIGTKAALSADGGIDSAIGGTGTWNEKRGKDFIEPRSLMGAGHNLKNRHAECTDCHQPHRVTRTVLFNGDPTIPAEKGTHRHGGVNDIGGVPHNNIASGSQRGQFGVEPIYGSDDFFVEPTGFIEKRGAVNSVGGTAVSTLGTTSGDYAVTNTYLTREYQVCAKCHSNYAFGPLQGSIANPTNIPPLGRDGGTPAGTNGMMFYTNIFREIQAPTGHKGEGTSTTPSGAFKGRPPYTVTVPDVDFQTNNHRSWHPVMGPTGRTPAIRGNLTASNWLAPWDSIGEQTMYCTDCHGSKTPAGFAQQAVDGEPEGPHGSDNIFMLKGWWDYCTGKAPTDVCLADAPSPVASNAQLSPAVIRTGDYAGTTDNDLCFKCHSLNVYAKGTGGVSGFSGPFTSNGHGHTGVRSKGLCMWCHVAVPHGWKNKAFLVNLNDVGPEATCRQEDADAVPVGYKCSEIVNVGDPMPPGTQVVTGYTYIYSNPPYYRRAILRLTSFAKSGQWNLSNCGSVGSPGNGVSGGSWMNGYSAQGCTNIP